MKRLFVIDSDLNMDLNREWLYLVPEFNKLMRQKIKWDGDYDGRRKIYQMRVFGYIYLMLDFASPLFNYEEDARRAEAMGMMNLKPDDIDKADVVAAYMRYDVLIENSSRMLKSLRGAYGMLDKLDDHFSKISFDETDKMGRPKYNSSVVSKSIKDINAMYDSLQTMERRVMDDLKQESNTIRGRATLGGKEGKRTTTVWVEGGSKMASEINQAIQEGVEADKDIVATELQPTMANLGNFIKPLTADEDEDS